MLIDKITPDEREIIDILRNSVEEEGSDFFTGQFADLPTFLRFWENAKAPIAKAFGGELILKKKIKSVVEDDELYDNMRRIFWSSDYEYIRNKLFEILEETNGKDWHCSVFRKSDGGRGYSMDFSIRQWLLSADNWVSNRYDGPTFEIKLPNNQVYKLIEGCKVMKALGRIIKGCNNAEMSSRFENLRLRQSQIMNEANIQATLCISIHPLDYMTASYNANDWSSCMNWEDGEFRRGVIEMMNSPMVVVGYIKSDSNKLSWDSDDYGTITWNSKRWREFFIVNENMIAGIKGYPYWNRTLEDEVIMWLRELFVKSTGRKYLDKIVNWHYPDTWGSRPTYKDDHVDVKLGFECGPAMYNDFYGGNDYHFIFVDGLEGEIYTSYSGESECVCCGDAYSDFDGESALVCNNCITVYSCCKCGDTITSEHDLIECNGNYYCRYCFEQLDNCDNCGEVMDVDNDDWSYAFVVGRDGETETDVLREAVTEDSVFGRYDMTSVIVIKVCENCAPSIFKDWENFQHKRLNDFNDWYHYYPIVPIDDLTEAGLALIDPEDLEYFKSGKSYRENSA